MADLNKVFLMGRLTFDPELRRTPSGTAVAELRMATTRGWQGRDGERREETLYIDVTVWDRQAETCCQFLKKGSAIHVEGSLRMDTWEDKNTGEKRSKIRVTADRVQFLDARRGEGAGSSGSDDDYGASSSVRDTASRRGATQNRASGGYVEAPGPSNGPSGAQMHATEPSNERGAEPGDADEEDIPF
jgi:single-strand DNA-binding protein